MPDLDRHVVENGSIPYGSEIVAEGARTKGKVGVLASRESKGHPDGEDHHL
jgi:hypothetical protein